MLEVVNALLVAERRRRMAAAAMNHAAGILRQMTIHDDPETHDQARDKPWNWPGSPHSPLAQARTPHE
jgi:hypothetical protein